MGDVANSPICGALLAVSRTLEPWGSPKAKGDIAKPPTCGPILTLSPALKRWGPPPPPVRRGAVAPAMGIVTQWAIRL